MSFTGCQLKFERQGNIRPFCLQPYSDAVSLPAAYTFGEFLSRYSCAKLVSVGWSETELVDIGSVKPGKYASIGLYAKIFLKHEDTGERRVVFIPSPIDSVFTESQDVELIIGQEVAREFSVLTGKNVIFRHGALWGSVVP